MSGISAFTKSLERISPLRNRFQRFPNESRRVMEGGLDRDFRIVERVRVHGTWVPRGQPPNKLTVPPRRTICSAHSHVCAVPTASITESAPRPPSVSSRTAFAGSLRSGAMKAARAPNRSAARIWFGRLPSAITFTPRPGQDADKFQSDRPATDDHGRVTRLYAGFMNSAKHASQRLDHRRILKRNVFRDHQHVLPDDSSRDADIFRVGAIVEQQVLAKIALPLAAKQADVARRRIRGNHARADLQAAIHVGAQRFDNAGKLVAEHRGRRNHARVISPLPDFQIRAAGQGDFDADQRLIRREPGNVHALDLQILASI